MTPIPSVALEDRAELVDIVVNDERQALQVNLIWQVADYPLGQDYQLELALVDSNGQTRSHWRAYQTQARYPTRTWEAGDILGRGTFSGGWGVHDPNRPDRGLVGRVHGAWAVSDRIENGGFLRGVWKAAGCDTRDKDDGGTTDTE